MRSENISGNTACDMELIGFLLREPKLYGANPTQLAIEVDSALAWFNLMVKTATDNGISLGGLCRIVLPFDLNTDARDQSNIASDLRIDSPVSGQTVKELRVGAVQVRRLLRVKVADEADMKQVRDVIGMISSALGKQRN